MRLPQQSLTAATLFGFDMYPKSLILPRSNILFALNYSPPVLGPLLKANKLSQELLDDLMEYDDQATAAGQSGVDPKDINLLLDTARKVKLLEPSSQQRLYSYLLRKGTLPQLADESSLKLLTNAYHLLMDAALHSNTEPKIDRLEGMLLFGRWRDIRMTDVQPIDTAVFQHLKGVLKQCGRYIHIPGMLAKLDKFAAYADDATAARILKALQALRFQHSKIVLGIPNYYDYTKLPFWGLCEIVLLNATTAEQLVTSFRECLPELPQSDQQLEILERFVTATGDPAARHKFVPNK